MDKTEYVFQDMSDSIKILRQATPIVKQLLNFDEGEVIDVENQDNDACQHLDMSCGIDYLLHLKRQGITQGAAWRAQVEHPTLGPFNSFTIRRERESGSMTEFEKRKISVKNNGIYPYYTIQAFYDQKFKNLLSLGIAKTTDILECIDKGLWDEDETGKNKVGQAKFYIVWWNVMMKNGYNIKVWKRQINSLY